MPHPVSPHLPQDTTQHSTAHHSTAQHITTRHSTSQHSIAQHSTARHGTARHGTARHGTAQHSTTRHSTAPLEVPGPLGPGVRPRGCPPGFCCTSLPPRAAGAGGGPGCHGGLLRGGRPELLPRPRCLGGRCSARGLPWRLRRPDCGGGGGAEVARTSRGSCRRRRTPLAGSTGITTRAT